MRTRKRNNVLMMTLICVTILGLGIGFAAFASNLTIKSTAQVTPDESDFSVVLSTTEGSTTYGSVAASSESLGDPATISESDPTTISGLKAKFTAPNQSVSYTFYARNVGAYLAYLNYITIGDKKCTADDGTNADMVTNACNGISISVKVKDDEPVTASTGLISSHTLAAGSAEAVVVKISYADGSALADGPFSVEFGDVKLTYSTVANYEVPADNSVIIYRYSAEPISIGDTINPSDYATDPTKLTPTSYLKHEVVNNKVTASYSCLAYTESGERKDLCLRGVDPTYYASNQEILREVEPYFNTLKSNACTIGDSSSNCVVISSPHIYELNANSDGYVATGSQGYGCNVYSDGSSDCA